MEAQSKYLEALKEASRWEVKLAFFQKQGNESNITYARMQHKRAVVDANYWLMKVYRNK